MPKPEITRRRRHPLMRSAALVALTSCVTLAGCAGTQTAFGPSARAQYSSAGDPCGQFREPFIRIREQQQQQVRQWAAIGAAIGASGATLATARGDLSPLERIAIGVGGAIVGGIVGAELGYQDDLKKRAGRTQGLQSVVYSDAQRYENNSDQLLRAVSSLNLCRLQTADNIESSFLNRGESYRAQATQQANQLAAAIEADNELIGSTLEGITEARSIFVAALKEDPLAPQVNYTAAAERYQPVIQPATYLPVAVAQPVTTYVSTEIIEEPAPAPLTSFTPIPAAIAPAPIVIADAFEPVPSTPVVTAPVVSVAAPIPSNPIRTNSNANLRQGPSTSTSILTMVPLGSTVNQFETVSGWSSVSYQGQTGFMAARLLGARPQSQTVAATTSVERATSGARLDTSSRPVTSNPLESMAIKEKETEAVQEVAYSNASRRVNRLKAVLAG